MKKILILLLSVICVLLVVPLNTLADDNSDTYEYTIRVFAGDKGAFSDGSAVKTIHARYGEEVNLSDYLVVPTENRYLFNGYRTSGRDNRWAEMPAFTAEKDVDYVAAYVIKGNVVHYTLRFVEYGTGRQLLADMVLEGNAGDKPIEAFRYVEGYRPLYRNITKTLSDNEAENVFVFEYVEIPAVRPEVPELVEQVPELVEQVQEVPELKEPVELVLVELAAIRKLLRHRKSWILIRRKERLARMFRKASRRMWNRQRAMVQRSDGSSAVWRWLWWLRL